MMHSRKELEWLDCGHVTAKIYVQSDNNSDACSFYIKTACIAITTKNHMTSTCIYIIHTCTSHVFFLETVVGALEPVEGMRLDSFLSLFPTT